jgi:hypothetical protein
VANGMSWVALTAFLTTIVAFFGTMIYFKHASDFMTFVTVLIVFTLHINAHGLFANFLRNLFSSDGKKSGVGQIAFLSFVITNIATAFIFNTFFGYHSISEGLLIIVNPFYCLSYHRSIVVGIIGGLLWFGLGILCNIKTIINQFKVYFNKGYD